MLTRAKRGLIIIGNRATLEADEYWGQWLHWAAARGCIQGERARGTWTARCLINEDGAPLPKTLGAAAGQAGPGAGEDTRAPHPRGGWSDDDYDDGWYDDDDDVEYDASSTKAGLRYQRR